MKKILNTSEEPKRRSNDAPSTDVGPDRFVPILTALFVMSKAASSWKGPRYLAYDTRHAVALLFHMAKIHAPPPKP